MGKLGPDHAGHWSHVQDFGQFTKKSLMPFKQRNDMIDYECCKNPNDSNERIIGAKNECKPLL